MNPTQILISLLFLGGVADAISKRWIPNTNFENASNWVEQRTPCSRDKVVFASGNTASVLIQSLHSVADLYMPLDGEFILSPNAGFMAAAAEDPGCGEGSVINFGDASRHEWFNPRLWESAVSTEDLDNGESLFSVDAERVPCQYDDVIFSPETSFRVKVPQTETAIQLRSLSVLGWKFDNNADFAAYLASRTGKLQFPGPAQPQVTNMRCQERSGCLCGNDGVLREICSALLQPSGNKCPEMPCANALTPHGHCCPICGAVISLEYSPEFDLETYRSRIIHSFLNLAKYSGAQLAMSKVPSSPWMADKNSLPAEPRIQLVVTDRENGSSAGTRALDLAQDIMVDTENHGQSLGILNAEMRSATGITTSRQRGAMSAASITGIVLGLMVGLALLGAAFFLYRTRTFPFPISQFFWSGQGASRLEEPEEHRGGFTNPIFDPAAEATEGKPGSRREASSNSGIHFSNPVFDCDVDV